MHVLALWCGGVTEYSPCWGHARTPPHTPSQHFLLSKPCIAGVEAHLTQGCSSNGAGGELRVHILPRLAQLLLYHGHCHLAVKAWHLHAHALCALPKALMTAHSTCRMEHNHNSYMRSKAWCLLQHWGVCNRCDLSTCPSASEQIMLTTHQQDILEVP